jgi:hypothetical protein
MVAASLVTVWLSVLGIELVGGSCLAKQGARDLVAPMEAAISSLGGAEISDDRWTGEQDCFLEATVFATTRSVFIKEHPMPVKFVMDGPRIYMLHATFLI